LDVKPDPARAPAPRPVVELASGDAPLTAGTPSKIAVRLRRPDGTPLSGGGDVRILTMLPPGVWHTRDLAPPARDGGYAVGLPPPGPGTYEVLVESRSQGMMFGSAPPLLVTVAGGAP